MSDVIISPCVGICALDAEDLCMGCYRTGEEISKWGAYSDAEKRTVLLKVAEREKANSNFIPIE